MNESNLLKSQEPTIVDKSPRDMLIKYLKETAKTISSEVGVDFRLCLGVAGKAEIGEQLNEIASKNPVIDLHYYKVMHKCMQGTIIFEAGDGYEFESMVYLDVDKILEKRDADPYLNFYKDILRRELAVEEVAVIYLLKQVGKLLFCEKLKSHHGKDTLRDNFNMTHSNGYRNYINEVADQCDLFELNGSIFTMEQVKAFL